VPFGAVTSVLRAQTRADSLLLVARSHVCAEGRSRLVALLVVADLAKEGRLAAGAGA